jgi:hypothetical protein
MMVAGDSKTFGECIQSIQSEYMGSLLQPITFATQTLGASLGNLSSDINNARSMIGQTRSLFSDAIASVFSVLMNLVVEFQTITLGLRDMFQKMIAIMVTLLYTMEGSILTMESTWNGPPGQMVRKMGKCFHPHSLISVWSTENDGPITDVDPKTTSKPSRLVRVPTLVEKRMCDVVLGDVLLDGSRVMATMQIDNRSDPETLYHPIHAHASVLVTGSHSMWCADRGAFVRVDTLGSHQVTRTSVTTPHLCCLITDTHRIRFNSDVLCWDWEDALLTK